MTHPSRSALARLNERITQVFYVAIVLACLSFAGMVLGPAGTMEHLLGLAWLFMLSAIGCLVGKFVLELALEFQEQTALAVRLDSAIGERWR